MFNLKTHGKGTAFFPIPQSPQHVILHTKRLVFRIKLCFC